MKLFLVEKKEPQIKYYAHSSLGEKNYLRRKTVNGKYQRERRKERNKLYFQQEKTHKSLQLLVSIMF